MSKQQMIDAICKHNQSASPDFLSIFDEKSLNSYLLRLTQVSNHRGPGSSWVREGTTPAIVSRRAVA